MKFTQTDIPMIKSMTGYARVTKELALKKIHLEIKSLNSKQTDINTRIPSIYKDKEIELRATISEKLNRGKIDIAIVVESLLPDRLLQVNQIVFENYYKQISALAEKYNLQADGNYIKTILSLPDTLKVEQVEADEMEWVEIKNGVAEAIEMVDLARTREGAMLEADLLTRAQMIAGYLSETEKFEKQRIEKIKERIKENLTGLGEKFKIDENRFEQEMIYYLEKIDISEEKTRLADHIKYFIETIAEEQPVGKKLGFITQELGREINTLGAKANDVDIQKLVIKMKDELEKIKEQSLNIL